MTSKPGLSGLFLCAACGKRSRKPVCRRCVTADVPTADPVLQERSFRTRYGITRADYDALRSAQDGRCCICGVDAETEGVLHVDHDHTTKKIRGLLCGPCNRGLGLFQDNPSRLETAAQYLRHNTLKLNDD